MLAKDEFSNYPNSNVEASFKYAWYCCSMLLQASVDQVRKQEIPRENSLIIITMCYYPRGIKKEWRDDFRSILAPDRELFKEWKAFEKEKGHDEAFKLSHYEERFSLTPIALTLLKVYGEWSREKDIYFVCQCKVGERCHREMLMLAAYKKYGAFVSNIFHTYPAFESRILKFHDKIWNSPSSI
jgi:uncharacterized protein YeaO (DUF488 family)